MLDARFVAEHPDVIRQSLVRRHASAETMALLDRLVAVNVERRQAQGKAEDLRAERNRLTKLIGPLMKEGKAALAEPLKEQVRQHAEALADFDAKVVVWETEERDLVLSLPNVLAAAVPEGAGSEDNPVVRTWGQKPELAFAAKEHDALAESMGLFDPERAVKLSGARFTVLWGDLARLERALVSFFLDRATGTLGYREVMVPYMVSRATMTGTGQLPKFEQDLFKLAAPLNGADAFLIPTAEVPVTNLHRDEILDEDTLPRRYAAFTPCFRSEAGAHGKDTRGMVRVHQFHKVELVQITTAEQGEAAWEALTSHAESMLQALGLPYRVVRLCGGDMGFGGHQTYDLEVWLPGAAAYREISSCTHFHDFQARRLKLRFRPKDGGKPVICHTVNGSGLAVGRTMVAILENYQQADGSIVIPEALRPYMGGRERIGAD